MAPGLTPKNGLGREAMPKPDDPAARARGPLKDNYAEKDSKVKVYQARGHPWPRAS